LEERSIELIAKGHSVGESLGMVLKVEEAPSIGRTMELTLEFPELEDGEELELIKGDVKGFDPVGMIIERKMTDEGLTTAAMKIVPTGKHGPTMVEVTVKGETYGATLSIQRMDLMIHPPQVEISLVEGGMEVIGPGDHMIPVKLKLPAGSKFKGDVHLSIVDGSDRTVSEVLSKNISFKGSRTVEMGLDLPELHQRIYSLKVDVTTKGRTRSRIFEDALHYVGELVDGNDQAMGQEKDPEEDGPRSVSFTFRPREVSPGQGTEMRLEVERPVEVEGELSVSIKLGKETFHDLSIPVDSSILNRSIQISDRVGTGNITAIINVSDESGSLFREVVPRALTVSGQSRLEIELATPHDLKDIGKDGFEAYLFPGESVRSRSISNGLEVITLTTGRHIFLQDGTLVLGHGWEGQRTGETFDHFMGMMITEVLLETSLHRNLRKEMERAGKVGVCSISGKDGKDPWGDIDGRCDAANVPMISGSILARYSSSEKNLMTLGKAKGVKVDPIPSIVNDIDDLFSSDDKVEDLKGKYEELIRQFRTNKEARDRSSSIRAHQIALKMAREALEGLRSEKDQVRSAKQLLFSVIIADLIRIETLTHWTNDEMSAWDELRVERQRMLKREISGLFDMLDGISSISTSLRKRLLNYKTNMTTRKVLSSLTNVRLVKGRDGFSGKGGEPWKGRIVIDIGKDSIGSEIACALRLPGLSWNLTDPVSQRDGPLFIFPDERIDTTGRIEMELNIAPPSVTSANQNAVFYIHPVYTRLEVED